MDTSDRILDEAEALIQGRGFSGFSFKDLAEAVGIQKASIYYHYPAKAELGRAVLDRYRERMGQAFKLLDQPGSKDFRAIFAAYVEPMIAFGRTEELACVSGVLGGEYMALPEDMRAEIKAFFAEHQAFLTTLLERGREAGAFAFAGTAESQARLILSAVEGALLIKRILGDRNYFDRIMATLQESLMPAALQP